SVNYAVQMGAKIVNNSWGGGGYDQAMASAITNAQNQGVIFVVAAGNAANNNDANPQYPANYANAWSDALGTRIEWDQMAVGLAYNVGVFAVLVGIAILRFDRKDILS
ncbi:MAG: S8 family serine peptidase, partial [Acidimicrobiaceae bacterium]